MFHIVLVSSKYVICNLFNANQMFGLGKYSWTTLAHHSRFSFHHLKKNITFDEAKHVIPYHRWLKIVT